MYLQGRRLNVESDHKPMANVLQLQKYNMTIQYPPGHEMQLADAPDVRSNPEIKLDLWVDYIAHKSAWIEKLRDTTCDDHTSTTVYQLTQHRWPNLRRKVPQVARYFWDF